MLWQTPQRKMCSISVASVSRRDVRGISINDKFRANRPAGARVWKGLFIIFVSAAASALAGTKGNWKHWKCIDECIVFCDAGVSGPIHSRISTRRAVRPAAHKFDISIVAGHVSKSVIVCVHRAATPNLGTRGEVASCASALCPPAAAARTKINPWIARGDTTQQPGYYGCGSCQKVCVRAPWHVVMFVWRFAATTPPRLSSSNQSRGMWNLNPHATLHLISQLGTIKFMITIFGIWMNRFLVIKNINKFKKYMFLSKFQLI